MALLVALLSALCCPAMTGAKVGWETALCTSALLRGSSLAPTHFPSPVSATGGLPSAVRFLQSCGPLTWHLVSVSCHYLLILLLPVMSVLSSCTPLLTAHSAWPGALPGGCRK